jgi:hypothetical protein
MRSYRYLPARPVPTGSIIVRIVDSGGEPRATVRQKEEGAEIGDVYPSELMPVRSRSGSPKADARTSPEPKYSLSSKAAWIGTTPGAILPAGERLPTQIRSHAREC